MIVKYNPTKAHQSYTLIDGSKVPGGSTIASVAGAYAAQSPLMRWAWKQGTLGIDYVKERDRAADIGTLAHWLIELELKGDTPDLSEFAPALVAKAESILLKFLTWWTQKEFTVLASEIQLVSEKNRYGGTLDIVACDKNGMKHLIDLKTGDHILDPYWFQCAGYAELWNEHNEEPEHIASIIICRLPKTDEENDVEIVQRVNWSKDFAVFMAGLKLYQALNERKSGEPKKQRAKKQAKEETTIDE